MIKKSPWHIINVLRIIYTVKRKGRIWKWMHENGEVEIL